MAAPDSAVGFASLVMVLRRAVPDWDPLIPALAISPMLTAMSWMLYPMAPAAGATYLKVSPIRATLVLELLLAWARTSENMAESCAASPKAVRASVTISEVDASVFILDFVPNASVEQMKERMETFYRIIRSKHPDTPIIFIEDPIFTHTRYDERIAKEVQRKNDTLKEIFNRLKKEDEKNIIFISSKNMLGEDGEATVDGVHFTDLGMTRYADLVCPIIKKAIK